MPVVYLSIGSNSDDPLGSLLNAIELILKQSGVKPRGLGSFYETEPQGKTDQPWFVNSAVSIDTWHSPDELLDMVKRIEKQLGRVPTERWGPREIDIDIIFYDNITVCTDELVIPHPLVEERRFVLKPLMDIDPKLVHPVLGETVTELYHKLPEEGQALRKLDP